MRQDNIKGICLLLLAALSWGIQFPVSKAALAVMDAFYITAIRYGIAALFFIVLVYVTQGRRALSTDGKAWPLFFYGSMGFAGYSFFGFVGVHYTSPEHGSIIMALMPLMTAMIKWVFKGQKPASFTLACIGTALVGVALVITRGKISSVLASGSGLGDGLMLIAIVCWVIYTLGAEQFSAWSPVRFTALSCTFGMVTVLAITILATILDFIHVPNHVELIATRWDMAYMTVFPAILASLSWNMGLKKIGTVNSILFMNFVPVTAFAIGLVQGHHFSDAEVTGAMLVIAALVANNLYIRRASAQGLVPNTGVPNRQEGSRLAGTAIYHSKAGHG